MILGILAGIAAPRLLGTADRAIAQAVITDVEAIFTAAEVHAARAGGLANDEIRGVLPTEFVGLIDARVFSGGTPLGGVYDWNGPGTSAPIYGVAIRGPLDNGLRLLIDNTFDDGVLTTGWITQAQDSGIKFELAPNP